MIVEPNRSRASHGGTLLIMYKGKYLWTTHEHKQMRFNEVGVTEEIIYNETPTFMIYYLIHSQESPCPL